MKILAPPLAEHIQQVFSYAGTLYIVSPWIKHETVQWVFPSDTSRDYRHIHILFSGHLADFITKSSDIETIEWLLEQGADIRSLLNLHAKVYLADGHQAIVTSANFTNSGFGFSRGYGNIEIGVLIEDSDALATLKALLTEWFSQGHIINKEWIGHIKQAIEDHSTLDARQKIHAGEDELCKANRQIANKRLPIALLSRKKSVDHFSIDATNDKWVNMVMEEIQRHKLFPSGIEGHVVEFFRKAFTHTYDPERAWFGIHSSGISLVVGGLYLAALHYSDHDKGIWLLVDHDPPHLEEWLYPPVHATQNSTNPLLWAHTRNFKNIAGVIDSAETWTCYARASEKIFHSPRVSADRDLWQQERGKIRLSALLQGHLPGEKILGVRSKSQDSSNDPDLTKVLIDIFPSQEQCEVGRQYFADALNCLPSFEAVEHIVSTTYRSRSRKLTLNIGNWEIFCIRWRKSGLQLTFCVHFQLFEESPHAKEVLRTSTLSARWSGGEPFGFVTFQWGAQPFYLDPILRAAWKRSILHAAETFGTWKSSSYKTSHRQDLLDFFTDEQMKKEILSQVYTME